MANTIYFRTYYLSYSILSILHILIRLILTRTLMSSPTLQKRETKAQESSVTSQRHTVAKCWSQESNPGYLAALWLYP